MGYARAGTQLQKNMRALTSELACGDAMLQDRLTNQDGVTNMSGNAATNSGTNMEGMAVLPA